MTLIKDDANVVGERWYDAGHVATSQSGDIGRDGDGNVCTGKTRTPADGFDGGRVGDIVPSS